MRPLIGHGPATACEDRRPGRMREILSLLLDAYRYAAELGRSPWDFAVEARGLRDAGMTTSDFRWLVCKGFARHAREVTTLEDDERSFERLGHLMMAKRACFVLTEAGAAFAEAALAGGLLPLEIPPMAGDRADGNPADGAPRLPEDLLLPSRREPAGPPVATASVPRWDRDRQELRLGGLLVKQFKVPAPNQEVILAAFEEESWPVRIDDPLPVHPCLAAKRRLHETITSLNRNQKRRLITFSGDGSGQGVRWSMFVASACANGVH